jgi:polysaccharide export outer membrane protein
MTHFYSAVSIGLAVAVWLVAAPGNAESGTASPMPTAKAGAESASVSAINIDNGDVRTSGDGPNVAAMEKLANAVSSDYLIGAEDVLEISVWRNQDLSRSVQVRPDGRISLPVVRDVVAVGKTPSQLADELTRKLREYVQNPVVAISVKELNSYNIFILGEVQRPGKYPLKSKTTLLQGLTIAGGFTPIAARNQVVIFRFSENGSGTKTIGASYDDIVLRGGVSQNLELKAGDTVVVPSETMVVFPGQKLNER